MDASRRLVRGQHIVARMNPILLRSARVNGTLCPPICPADSTRWSVAFQLPSDARPQHGARRGSKPKERRSDQDGGQPTMPPNAWTEAGRRPVFTKSSASREPFVRVNDLLR